MGDRARLWAVVGVLAAAVWGVGAFGAEEAAAPSVTAKAALDVQAAALKETVVTPVLEQKLEPGKNVLWCCTFQLCWNELSAYLGGHFAQKGAPPVVALLNREAVTKDVLDEPSYVAMAGSFGDDTLDKIREEMARKFGRGAAPQLLPLLDDMAPGLWYGYAYLRKALPFRWAFTRFGDGMNFGGRQVAGFGINQYLEMQRNEVMMATQVVIYDYRSDDDFIVELKTVSSDDRLVLARVPPGETLGATVAGVRRRVSESKPTGMQEAEDLYIPVLDFDITKDYPELGRLGFVLAKQRTRFRLDEKGALLESEAVGVGGGGARRLVFDGPFLLLMERRGAAAPYLALWVANAELLVPMEPEGEAG
jgi:hypothetical protein